MAAVHRAARNLPLLPGIDSDLEARPLITFCKRRGLFQMPRWDRRLRIVLDWTVALFFRPDITKVELRVEREQMRGRDGGRR